MGKKITLRKFMETLNPSLREVIFSKVGRLTSIGGPGIEVDDFSVDVGEVSFEDIADNKQLQSKLRSNAFTLLGYFEKNI